MNGLRYRTVEDFADGMKRYSDVDGYIWEERPGSRLEPVLTDKGEAIVNDYPDFFSEVERNYGPLTEVQE